MKITKNQKNLLENIISNKNTEEQKKVIKSKILKDNQKNKIGIYKDVVSASVSDIQTSNFIGDLDLPSNKDISFRTIKNELNKFLSEISKLQELKNYLQEFSRYLELDDFTPINNNMFVNIKKSIHNISENLNFEEIKNSVNALVNSMSNMPNNIKSNNDSNNNSNEISNYDALGAKNSEIKGYLNTKIDGYINKLDDEISKLSEKAENLLNEMKSLALNSNDTKQKPIVSLDEAKFVMANIIQKAEMQAFIRVHKVLDKMHSSVLSLIDTK